MVTEDVLIKLIVVEAYSFQAVDQKSVQISEFVRISESTDYIWRPVHLI